MSIAQGMNGTQYAQAGGTQDHEVIGQIRGLLEAWTGGGKMTLLELHVEKRRRIRELRDLLSYDYIVNVLTAGNPSDRAFLTQLQEVM